MSCKRKQTPAWLMTVNCVNRRCPATWAHAEQAATLGMSECVIGMPHRGRLNASWTSGVPCMSVGLGVESLMPRAVPEQVCLNVLHSLAPRVFREVVT